MKKNRPPLTIVVGTRLRCAQPDCGPGLVYRLSGSGKKRRYDVVCLDGQFHNGLTEHDLRGRDWKIRRLPPASPDEVHTAVEQVRARMEAARKAEESAVRERNVVAGRIRGNPAFGHLSQGNDPRSGRLAAANIRRDLYKTFGRTFGVRRIAFGTLHVVWTDGPTVADVEAVVGKFRAGHGGPVSAWCSVFGGSECLQLQRNASAALIQRAIDAVFEAYPSNLSGIEKPHLEEFTTGHLWGANVPGLEDNLQLLIQAAIDELRG